jgi:hypothetical protein
MNINKLKEIVENAPEGATLYDEDSDYYCAASGVPFLSIWHKGTKCWCDIYEIQPDADFNMRSLEDIRTIIELYEGLQNAIEACYDLDSFGVRETNSDYINTYKLLERFE